MKNLKNTFAWFGALSLCCGAVVADEDMDISMQNLSGEHILEAKDAQESPFRISAHGDWIGKSKINKHGHRHQSINFSTAEIQAEGIVYYNPDCKEGLGLGVSYTHSRFDWHKRRHFSAQNLEQVSFTLTGFTERVHKWLWMGSVVANWEPKYNNFTEYTNYDIVFWGRYECDKDINMHMGFLAQTGMKIDRIYPIIGVDWKINDKWKLNAVYPMNISVVYTINDAWSASFAGRLFDLRYRLGKHDARGFAKRNRYKKALLQYRNTGAELAINYDHNRFSANLHGGVTFGGQFIFSNRHNKRKKHFDLDSAGYVGGEAVVKF